MDIRLNGRCRHRHRRLQGPRPTPSRCASPQSGADVAIAARGREALDEAVKDIQAQAKGQRHRRAPATSACPPTSSASTTRPRKIFGKIDIVVNNAGTSRNGSFEEITDEVWREDIDQKVFAAIRLTQARLARHEGAQMGSRHQRAQHRRQGAAQAGSAPTTISRAAGMALTKVLSHEGAPHGILVNAMLVGFIESDQHVQRASKEGIALTDYVSRRDQGHPAPPHRQGGGVREPRLLPGFRRRVLHHRHRHQCRRRSFSDGVDRRSLAETTSLLIARARRRRVRIHLPQELALVAQYA